MNKIALAIVPTLLLAGCGQSADEVQIMPGKWEITAGMTKFEIPGATEEQAAMFKDATGQSITQEQCILQEQADLGPEAMAEAFKQGGDCSTNEFTKVDGAISGQLSCKMDDGSTVDTAIEGEFATETFTMSMDTQLQQEALPGGKADVTMQVTGKRVGDCD